ncbi:MAG: hypothetical protein ACXV7C_04075, partial [Candidatus Angelobacter sp.]
MIRRLILCIFTVTAVMAQTPQSTPKKPASTTPPASATPTPQATPPSLLKRDEKPAELPPDAPVISIRG